MKPSGFREYDARWLFPEEINLMGMQAIGMAMATLMRERGAPCFETPGCASSPAASNPGVIT